MSACISPANGDTVPGPAAGRGGLCRNLAAQLAAPWRVAAMWCVVAYVTACSRRGKQHRHLGLM